MLSVPLLGGRMISDRDVRAAERNAVINEAAAALWPQGADPIGQRMVLAVFESPVPAPLLAGGTPSSEVTIVGVIANTRNNGVEAEPQPAILLPYSVLAPPQRQLAIRTAGPPSAIVNAVRSIVSEMDPLQPVSGVIAMDEIVQTREIGIRMTLGARALDILRLVCGAGGKLIAVGFLVGTAGAIGVTRLMAPELNLFGAGGADPLRQLSIAVVLAAVALIACVVPAWRAAKVTPVDARR